MFDNLVHDLQMLAKADGIIGRIRLQLLVRQSGLFAFAGLIAVFGLGMANVAGFYALEPLWGPVWAAAAVSFGDFLIAAVVILAARRAKPGPEIDLALELRQNAVDALRNDAAEIRTAMDSLSAEVRQTRDSVLAFAHNPLGAAADKLLAPAVIAVIRALQARKRPNAG